ncbi:hypothetical protein NPS68_26340, partial [Escherichia coli]|uniref:hypothetical protein n=1 Tax=Escherichia coli TaxID=562 RepID=UPI0021135BF1
TDSDDNVVTTFIIKSDVVPALRAGAASLFSYEGGAQCWICVMFFISYAFFCGFRTVRFRGPRVSVGGAYLSVHRTGTEQVFFLNGSN